MKPYGFEDKHILITGATGGIGAILAKRLSDAGATLLLSARSVRDLAALKESLPFSDRAQIAPADLSVPGEAKKLAKSALQMLGHVDAFFNLAGIGYFALMEESREKNIRHLFELNTFSPMILMRELVPHMVGRNSGRMVNIVSCAGRIPIPTEGVYGGSKSALAIMANTMRFELEPRNIDILNIYAGTTATDFERNALREYERPGVCPIEGCGEPYQEMAEKYSGHHQALQEKSGWKKMQNGWLPGPWSFPNSLTSASHHCGTGPWDRSARCFPAGNGPGASGRWKAPLPAT